MQVAPSPILADVIKHFLIIESNFSAGTCHRMFSDGNTGMVFNFRDPLLHQDSGKGETALLPQSFVYGQLDAYQNIIAKGKLGLVIAVFHPYGASAFLKLPATELKNQIIDTTCFFSKTTELLLEQIQEQCDTYSRIKAVENFLIATRKTQDGLVTIAAEAVRLIHHHHGNLPITSLLTSLQISERQLQRTFEEHVGISPKRYSGVTRIQFFLKLLRNRPLDTSLTSLGYDSGFYDQAHLIRELKNISGITPRQYISKNPPLAANLVPILPVN